MSKPYVICQILKIHTTFASVENEPRAHGKYGKGKDPDLKEQIILKPHKNTAIFIHHIYPYTLTTTNIHLRISNWVYINRVRITICVSYINSSSARAYFVLKKAGL